jgi:mono/diheme cytochrome c family protein
VRARRHRTFALAAAGLAACITAAGCGRSEEPDLVNGKTLFSAKCGSCHTLKRANTKGIQGPNLDDAFAAARHDGLGEDTIEGVVKRQIGNVRRTSIMPRNLVNGEDRQDVAAYVAMVASVPGKDTGALAEAGLPKTSKKPVVARNGVLLIAANPTGALAFVASKATAPAGKLQFAMPNKSSTRHNIAVQSPAGQLLGKGPVVGKGGASKFSATLKAGKYTFLCTVPGHAAGGMKGDLTVK